MLHRNRRRGGEIMMSKTTYLERMISRLGLAKLRADLDEKHRNCSMKLKSCRVRDLIQPIEFSKVPMWIYCRTPQYHYRNLIINPPIAK